MPELRPAYLVIDEADCIERWRQDFRPEYGRLAEVRSLLGNPPVPALTATAGQADEVIQFIAAAGGTREHVVGMGTVLAKVG